MPYRIPVWGTLAVPISIYDIVAVRFLNRLRFRLSGFGSRLLRSFPRDIGIEPRLTDFAGTYLRGSSRRISCSRELKHYPSELALRDGLLGHEYSAAPRLSGYQFESMLGKYSRRPIPKRDSPASLFPLGWLSYTREMHRMTSPKHSIDNNSRCKRHRDKYGMPSSEQV